MAVRAAPGASIALAALALAAVAYGWARGGGTVDLAWAPSLDLRLHLRLDGIGALYGLLATGIGLAVLVYSRRYLPLHLEHQGRPARDQLSFYGLLLLFLGSMVGLATAQDLILLFVFWDLTAVASYFLIAYDRHEAHSRAAALMALLVTGVSAVLLLVAALVLYDEHGTFSLPELFRIVEPSSTTTLAAALIALAGLAKSAQVPFHFWLPRAMAAPTPVSAYLHSAAMVAAGVLLLGRAYPLLEESSLVLDGLLALGAASIVVGGALALVEQELKRVLAYSTVSQYGYVAAMYGLGPLAAGAAALYVLTHAIAKSALFMTAGAVTESTGGRKRLADLGGLGRDLPLLAASSAVAAATVAALPLTLGFFADEAFFAAATERGTPFAVGAVAAAALTVAYLGRFWLAIFVGRRSTPGRPLPAAMVLPVAGLAALALAGGLVPGPAAELAADAGEATVLAPTQVEVAYHLDLRAENLMAMCAWLAGGTLLVLAGRLRPLFGAVARAGARLGPERLYNDGLVALNALSDRIHDLEVRDLRIRVAAVLGPAAILTLAGVIATPTEDAYVVGTVRDEDLGLVLVLVLACVGALAATLPRTHLTLALVLATVGYALAAVYAFVGAPDVALVAVLVETLFALLFVGIFALLPRAVLDREAALPTRRSRRWRDAILGVVSGGVAFALAWAALSRPTRGADVASEHVRLAPQAHGEDVVTVILADFRALDTLGEVTVVAVAFAGVVLLLSRRRTA